jgi:hypothetical protein
LGTQTYAELRPQIEQAYQLSISKKLKDFVDDLKHYEQKNYYASLRKKLKDKLQKFFGSDSKAQRSFDMIEELVLKDASWEEMALSNSGVIGYLSRQLATDEHFYTASLKFYSQLLTLDQEFLKNSTRQLPNLFEGAASAVDLWKLALDSASGDVSDAQRVLTLFGHDDVANQLRYFEGITQEQALKIDQLNVLRPDSKKSLLYQNQVVQDWSISPKLKDKFNELYEQGKLLETEIAKSSEKGLYLMLDSDRLLDAFRSGNYHYMGGVYLVNELTRRGLSNFYGFKTSVMIAETLGFVYKKSVVDVYLSPHAKKLYQLSLSGKSIEKPKEWSDLEFKIAKWNLEINLLHLEYASEQHFKGAQWAFQTLAKFYR